MAGKPRLSPIYTTRGDVGAVLAYPFLYNLQGEWIGWVTAERDVYAVSGKYVGVLGPDLRILRRIAFVQPRPDQTPPGLPPAVRLPAHFPLPPLMAELPRGMFDVLDDEPERLPPYGAFESDLDL